MVSEAPVGPARNEHSLWAPFGLCYRYAGDPFLVRASGIRHSRESTRRCRERRAIDDRLEAGPCFDEVLACHGVVVEVVSESDTLVVGKREERGLRDTEIRDLLTHLEERRSNRG